MVFKVWRPIVDGPVHLASGEGSTPLRKYAGKQMVTENWSTERERECVPQPPPNSHVKHPKWPKYPRSIVLRVSRFSQYFIVEISFFTHATLETLRSVHHHCRAGFQQRKKKARISVAFFTMQQSSYLYMWAWQSSCTPSHQKQPRSSKLPSVLLPSIILHRRSG